MIKKSTILKIFNIFFWLIIGSGLSFLLISAIVKEQTNQCKGVQIDFMDEKLINMIDRKEVYASLWPGLAEKYPVGKNAASFNLFALENTLSKNPWIERADIYFDNQQLLHFNIKQKSPVARLFTSEGYSYYLDKSYNLLPLKQTDHIVLPVFTNYYVNPTGMKKSDSMLLERIVSLSTYFIQDSFWMAQVESVYIKPDNGFELSTQVGDHVVDLGLRSEWGPMFKKLKLLYQKFNEEDSWNRYDHINLQFKDQVVCERSGAKLMYADSVQTDSIQISQKVINNNTNPKYKPQ
ncbi:MAG: cell division protein FtsQ/DivIB [Bacteroidota bacterium]|jgi:cell division protein FtsQ